MILIKSPGMIIFEIDDTLNITVNDDTVENKVYKALIFVLVDHQR